MKSLITGASGFIGSFLVDEALHKGWEVWAGVRKTSSKTYLTDFCRIFLGSYFVRPVFMAPGNVIIMLC